MARPGAPLRSRSFFSFISALWCMISLVNHMNILVIEDEQLLSGSLRELLAQHGFAAEAAYDGPLGLELALTGVYDLIILDVMLPGMDGYEIARRLRSKRVGTPILMLTARSGLDDRVEGLDAGADYYLAKPFETRELLACINAILRRQGAQVEELRYGDAALDLASAELVRCLFSAGGRIVSKETLLVKVWGWESEAVENNVEVYVGFLRRKLAALGSAVKIKAQRSLGYRLEAE